MDLRRSHNPARLWSQHLEVGCTPVYQILLQTLPFDVDGLNAVFAHGGCTPTNGVFEAGQSRLLFRRRLTIQLMENLSHLTPASMSRSPIAQ